MREEFMGALQRAEAYKPDIKTKCVDYIRSPKSIARDPLITMR